MNWNRHFTELRNSAALRSLSAEEFRIWFNLMCLASEQKDRGVIAGYSTFLLAVETLNGDEFMLSKVLKKLLSLRLIERNGFDISMIVGTFVNTTSRLPWPEWSDIRNKVFSRDGYACQYCGNHGDHLILHCDHVYPISRGGSNELSNLKTACAACNQSKHDKTVQEWKGDE